VSDRMEVAVLERALVDLGRHLAYPPAQDLAPSVAERLEGVRPLAPPLLSSPRARRIAVLAAAIITVLVGGALVASPALRAAILRLFTLPGVRIEIQESPPAVGRGLDLGERVSLDDARGEAGFPVAVPSSLGDPDEVYLDTPPADGLVSLVWRAQPGLPEASESGAGAVLTQFRAQPDEEFIVKKLAASGVLVVEVLVDGATGYWVEGPHTVFVVTEGGSFIEDRARTAGNTLLWSRGDVTLRLETALGMEQALAIAGSVE
jgi:hypothetical protein